MKHIIIASLVLTLAAGFTSCSRTSVAAESSKSAASGKDGFVNAYRKALESGDSATLDSFLLTEGSSPEIVEFFKMMREVPAGTSVVSVELKTPTAEEAAKLSQAMPSPDGKMCKLPIAATRQLVVTMKTTGANGNGTSTSTVPVAEKDGKFVIPLPVPAE